MSPTVSDPDANPSAVPGLCADSERLAALAAYDVLDTPREQDFDDIAALAGEICGTPIAVVNFVAATRQWFKAEVGLGVSETPLDVSFCAHALLEADYMEVPDATADPRFKGNPLVTGGPALRFYAGALLRTAEGQAIGTLCVLDHQPRQLTEQQSRALLRLARQVMGQLELRRALRARDAATSHLNSILASAIDYAIIATDADRRVTSWNKGAETVLGWTEAEMLGQSSDLMFTATDRSAGVPQREADIARTVGRATNERFHVRKDGSTFYASGVLTLRGEGAGQGFLKILRDRTDQRDAEMALRESEARFRHMADSAPALIWMTDKRGHVTFANMHHEYLFGAPVADMLGRGWERFVLPEDRDPYHIAFLQALAVRGPFRTEIRTQARDGRLRWLRVEGVPRLDDGGTFLGYTGCSMDVTEARLASADLEARIADRTAALSQAVDALHSEALEREQAEEKLRQAHKMEAVGQLTGGIAHDFNNMLQAIGGSLEIMRRRLDRGRAGEIGPLLDGAARTAQRAGALTNRLLAFARRQALQPVRVEPDALVEGMVDLVRRTVGPGIAVELALGTAPPVLCDPNQLESALLNLAINARDAMPDGGRLRVGTGTVTLGASEVAAHDGAAPGVFAELTVSDTGTGMAPEVLARVFEPFFTTKPLGQGTGLGLSQLYGFVQQSGGVVHLHSAPGRGTTVHICLPRLDGDAPASAGLPDAAGQAPVPTAATVLLVEDESDVRAMAAETLRDHGYQVLEAPDGPHALRLLRTGARVDVLVTDVGLPGGLNGRQVADAARVSRPGLPVLFITGYAGSAMEEQLEPGMALIGKPFALQDLAAQIGALLR